MDKKKVEKLKKENTEMKREIASMCDLCAVPLMYEQGNPLLNIPSHGVARCTDASCPLFQWRPPKYKLD